MGYGARALQILQQYYEFKIPSIDDDAPPQDEIENVNDEEVDLLEESIEPRKKLPPLLLKLSERRPEKLDYLGVSFGLTEPLLKFWKKSGYIPVYLRQTTNDLTGEHSCIMINVLNSEDRNLESDWLSEYWVDFRRRFINLLGYQFQKFSPGLSLGVLTNKARKTTPRSKFLVYSFIIISFINCLLFYSDLTRLELDVYVTKYDIKRLEMYSNNLVDYHLIIDLMPALSKIYFQNEMGDVTMSAVQSVSLFPFRIIILSDQALSLGVYYIILVVK